MYKDCQFLGFGLGFRDCHEQDFLAGQANVDWIEVITETYIQTEERVSSRNLENLLQLRQEFPVVCHGVSLSIGSVSPLNRDYLKNAKALYEIIEPQWVSDHLCWTGLDRNNSHDLLPLPYTEEAIQHIVDRVNEVQDFYQRSILLENVSSYVEFETSEVSEWEFLVEVAKRSGAGILLDLNNIHVSAFNHGYDPMTYLEFIPEDLVGQFHLAGPTDKQNHLIDTHSTPVPQRVWDLYEAALRKFGSVSTMIERDQEIPPLKELEAELAMAKEIFERVRGNDVKTVAL